MAGRANKSLTARQQVRQGQHGCQASPPPLGGGGAAPPTPSLSLLVTSKPHVSHLPTPGSSLPPDCCLQHELAPYFAFSTPRPPPPCSAPHYKSCLELEVRAPLPPPHPPLTKLPLPHRCNLAPPLSCLKPPHTWRESPHHRLTAHLHWAFVSLQQFHSHLPHHPGYSSFKA